MNNILLTNSSAALKRFSDDAIEAAIEGMLSNEKSI
jgi:hypothetical protein